MARFISASGASAYAIVWRLIRGYILPQHRYWMTGTVCMLFTAAATAGLAQYLTPIFDDIFIAHRHDLLPWISAGVLGVFLVKGGTEYLGERCLASMGYTLSARLQEDLFARMIYFDLGFFRNHHEAECTSLISQNVQIIRETLLQNLTALIRDVFLVISLAIVLLRKDAGLFIAALCILPIMAGLLRYCGRHAKRIFTRIQEENSALQTFFQQVFHQIVMVKAYGMESYEKLQLQSKTHYILRQYKKAVSLQALVHPFMEILGGIAIASIIVYGGSRVIAGTQTTGSFLTFITALFFLYRPIKNILQVHTRLQACIVAGTRIFQILDKPLSEQETYVTGDASLFSGEIRLDHVHFSYDNKVSVLKDVSFVFQAGKHYAIVGGSGAGKSTLFHLLLQLYHPQHGTLSFSGHDAASYAPRWIREHIGFVSQDIVLFDTTIQENIAYGTPGASFDDIRRVSQLSQVDVFVKQLPQEYQTNVGPHGAKLSGGQRQRIALARALLKRSPILLLDEATSALDMETEERIRTMLCHLDYPCTRISIAHRLSSVQNLECIVVLGAGGIQEYGTHHELLAKGGYYTSLWNQGREEANAFVSVNAA